MPSTIFGAQLKEEGGRCSRPPPSSGGQFGLLTAPESSAAASCCHLRDPRCYRISYWALDHLLSAYDEDRAAAESASRASRRPRRLLIVKNVKDVPVAHPVLATLGALPPALLGLGLGAGFEEVVVGDDDRPHEPLRQVRVDGASRVDGRIAGGD